MTTENGLFGKLRWGYRFTALTLLNTLAALVLLNAALSVGYTARDLFRRNVVSEKYGQSTLNAVYQGMSEREIDELLKETWSRAYVHEPFTQFKEQPYRGLYVNVDSNGFRVTKNQGPWPPSSASLNIFLLGGSTTFGYGVPDDQTIASHLQDSLTAKLGRDVRIYNFGRGHYYSTQERILFEDLLASGFVPDLAIFIDGLNDFCFNSNEPQYTDAFREFVARGATSNFGEGLLSATSLGRAIRGIRHRLAQHLQPDSSAAPVDADIDRRQYGDTSILERVIRRYVANKKLIEAVAKPYGVIPIFVWQPVPTYHLDQKYHPFAEGGYGQHGYSKFGYERMAGPRDEELMTDNFLWLADIQQDAKGPLYIDKVHYGPALSKRMAATLTDMLVERSELPIRQVPHD